MSVVGIDFGNESCYIAVAKGGGIETIANDYSLRATPSCVAFQERARNAGVAAANQRVTNMKNTIVGFKRLLGRKFNDPFVQNERKYMPYEIVSQANGSIGIKVRYMDEEQVFSPEQITAMLFTHLKTIAESALGIQVHDCVISVPWFYTQAERMALLDAAHIAGLNVLRLFNETTSTALAYGIYKPDLPTPEEKPRNIVFVDCGHSSLQVFAVAFNRGKLKVLAAAADSGLGGRDFDRILTESVAKEFIDKYRVNAMNSPKAYLRLSTEVEKLKKQMSANSTKLPLNIECFMDDKDVSSSLQRSFMEESCQHLLQRAEQTLLKCLHDSKLSTDDIHSVEIVGGSSRVPAIKNLIEQVFKKAPSTTLNQDEAVARGCALQCAILSPAIRVKDFQVVDVQNYAVKMRWSATDSDPESEMEIFPALYNVPFSRMTSLPRNKPFDVDLFYSETTPYPDPFIAKYAIQDVKPTADKIKLKLRVNLHGLVLITTATCYEAITAAEHEQLEKQKMDVEVPVENGGDATEPPSSQTDDNKEEQVEEEKVEEKKEKRKFRQTDLALGVEQYGMTDQQRLACLEAEGRMASNDKQEKDRVDAKNSLEEYVYDLRGKIEDEALYGRYITPSDRSKSDTLLGDIINWLYEDGEDCPRNVYNEKLDELKRLGEPIKSRKIEAEVRPAVLEDLARSIQQSYRIIDNYYKKDEKYVHIPEEDITKAGDETSSVEKWLEEQRVALQRTPLYENPPVSVAEIRQRKQTFESIVAPIYNKPKPKVEPPPAEAAPDAADPAAAGSQSENPSSPKPEDKMDAEG